MLWAALPWSPIGGHPAVFLDVERPRFFLFWLPGYLFERYDMDLATFGLPLAAIYLISDVGSVLGGWMSSRLIKAGCAGVGNARAPLASPETTLRCLEYAATLGITVYFAPEEPSLARGCAHDGDAGCAVPGAVSDTMPERVRSGVTSWLFTFITMSPTFSPATAAGRSGMTARTSSPRSCGRPRESAISSDTGWIEMPR